LRELNDVSYDVNKFCVRSAATESDLILKTIFSVSYTQLTQVYN